MTGLARVLSLLAVVALELPLFCGGAPAATATATRSGFPACSSGKPGSRKARWPIKTTLAAGVNLTPLRIPAADMATAPDLLLEQRISAQQASSSSVTLHAYWADNAQVQRALTGEKPPPGATFSIKLPQLSTAAYRAAFEAGPNGERPTQLGYLIAQAYDETRIPNPVTVDTNPIREGTIVQVDGYVYAVGCETDRDYHIDVVASPDNPSGAVCFVAEIPLPAYIPSARLAGYLTRARTAGASLKPKEHVRLTGQFFYDAWHMPSTQAGLNADPGGGRGKSSCAGTLWEIHPVISVQPLSP